MRTQAGFYKPPEQESREIQEIRRTAHLLVNFFHFDEFKSIRDFSVVVQSCALFQSACRERTETS